MNMIPELHEQADAEDAYREESVETFDGFMTAMELAAAVALFLVMLGAAIWRAVPS